MFEYRFADACIRTTSLIPELVPADHLSPADVIVVEWCDTFPPVVAQWFHQWGDDHDLWARFGDTGSEYVVEFPALAEFRISHDATRVRGRLQPEVPAFTGRHLLLNQILPLVLSRRGRLVLHAGAVSIRGEVVAFIGPTGSGKSTLVAACANAGAAVVADDSLVVSLRGDQWIAWPSYPAVRLWPTAAALVEWQFSAGAAAAHYSDKATFGPATGAWGFATGPLPISAIVRLGDETGTKAVAADLYSQVFRLDVRDREETVHLFHRIADLAAAVSVRTVDGSLEHRTVAALAALGA